MLSRGREDVENDKFRKPVAEKKIAKHLRHIAVICTSDKLSRETGHRLPVYCWRSWYVLLIREITTIKHAIFIDPLLIKSSIALRLTTFLQLVRFPHVPRHWRAVGLWRLRVKKYVEKCTRTRFTWCSLKSSVCGVGLHLLFTRFDD